MDPATVDESGDRTRMIREVVPASGRSTHPDETNQPTSITDRSRVEHHRSLLDDAKLVRQARHLVERVLQGEVGQLPLAGNALRQVREVLGDIGGDYRYDDEFVDAAERPAHGL